MKCPTIVDPKTLEVSQSEVNFTNVLRAAFTHADLKSVKKKTNDFTVFLCF